jgi:FolB domain-containing protein
MLIKIKNLETECSLGIYQWEKTRPTKIIINLEMATNLENSTISDDINDTIDYQIIHQNIDKIIKKKHYNLIEHLAHEILEMTLENKLINKAKIEIDKMKIFENVYSCAVVLEKNNRA